MMLLQCRSRKNLANHTETISAKKKDRMTDTLRTFVHFADKM